MVVPQGREIEMLKDEICIGNTGTVFGFPNYMENKVLVEEHGFYACLENLDMMVSFVNFIFLTYTLVVPQVALATQLTLVVCSL